MARRNKSRKSKYHKLKKPLKKPIPKPHKLTDQPLKNAVIIEFVKQIPFWWKQTEEFRIKILAWILSQF